MKKLIAILLLLAASDISFAQDPVFLWAKQFKGLIQGNSNTIALDASGNVYTTGMFSGNADFDPGPGVYMMNAFNGGPNIFVVKLNSAGNFLWAKQVEGNGHDHPNGICVDAMGNIIITGQFTDTADFDPGAGVLQLICSGNGNDFLWKLDPNGNLVWAKQMGALYTNGANPIDSRALASDQSGNIYIAGSFSGSIDFDPGPAIYTQNSNGAEDAFVCKLNSSGNFVWMKHIGGNSSDHAQCISIKIDASGNVYTTGTFYGTGVDFDPGAGVFILNSGFNISKTYFSKLDASGNFVWAKQMVGIYDPSLNNFGGWGRSLALDVSGNILIAGTFAGLVDFDCNAGTFNLTSIESQGYVAKYDGSGNFLWARKSTEYNGNQSSTAYFNSVTTDAAGNVYCTGFFYGTVDFDTGPGNALLTTMGINDAFIIKLMPSGEYVWTKQMGGGQAGCGGFSIVVDGSGNIYTAGSFDNTVDFNPDTGVFYLNGTAGYENIFLQKLGTCNNSTSTIYASACDSFILNQHKYDSTGTYMQVVHNNSGCDSTIFLKLTIGRKISQMSAVVCRELNWNGTVYSVSGTYSDTLTSWQGCDSIVILDLTIMPDTKFSETVTACAGQVYAGYSVAGTYIDTFVSNAHCDSIRTLKLDFMPWTTSTLPVTICKGEVYLGYSTSGTYSDSSAGCKIVNTILTVKDGCIPILVPSAFTPNHDGLNDVFKPVIKGAIKEYRFQIFNRWGQKLFDTEKYLLGWDGSFNGKNQPVGTYVYMISFEDGNGNEVNKRGTISLIK